MDKDSLDTFAGLERKFQDDLNIFKYLKTKAGEKCEACYNYKIDETHQFLDTTFEFNGNSVASVTNPRKFVIDFQAG